MVAAAGDVAWLGEGGREEGRDVEGGRYNYRGRVGEMKRMWREGDIIMEGGREGEMKRCGEREI